MAASDAEIGQRIEGLAGRFLVTRGDFNALKNQVQEMDRDLDSVEKNVKALQGVPGLVDTLRADVQAFGGKVRGLVSEVGAILTVLEMGEEAAEVERGMILRQRGATIRRRSRRLDVIDSAIDTILKDIGTMGGDVGGLDRDIDTLGGLVQGLRGDLDSHTALAQPLLGSIPGIQDKLVGLDADIDALGTNLSGLGSDLASHVTTANSRFSDMADALKGKLDVSFVDELVAMIPTDKHIVDDLVIPNRRTDTGIVSLIQNQFGQGVFDIEYGKIRGTALWSILDSIQDQIDDFGIPTDFKAVFSGLKSTFWGTGAKLRTKVIAEEGALRSLRTGFVDAYQRFGAVKALLGPMADSMDELRKQHKGALQNAKNWLDALRGILDDAIYGGGDGIRPSRKTFLANLDAIKNGIKARYDAAIAAFEARYNKLVGNFDSMAGDFGNLETLFGDMGGNLKTLADSELNLLNSQKLNW